MKKFEMLDKMLVASQKGLFREPKPPKPSKGRRKRDVDDYAYERPVIPPPPAPEEPLGPDQALTEHQLAVLFKMTSSFAVPADGIIDYALGDADDPNDYGFSDEEKYARRKLNPFVLAFLALDSVVAPHLTISFEAILWEKMNFLAQMERRS